MVKEEYLARVQRELGFMTSERYNEACAYFESCFDGTQSDEDVMNELGSPKNAAKNYYGGYVKSRLAPKGVKRANIPKGLLAALIIILLPVLIPAAITAVVAAFVLLGIAVSLIALFPAVTVSMWIGGAGIFLNSFTHRLMLFDRLIEMGTGLALFGFGLVLTWLIAKWYIRMFPAIIRGIVNVLGKLLKRISPESGGVINEE